MLKYISHKRYIKTNKFSELFQIVYADEEQQMFPLHFGYAIYMWFTSLPILFSSRIHSPLLYKRFANIFMIFRKKLFHSGVVRAENDAWGIGVGAAAYFVLDWNRNATTPWYSSYFHIKITSMCIGNQLLNTGSLSLPTSHCPCGDLGSTSDTNVNPACFLLSSQFLKFVLLVLNLHIPNVHACVSTATCYLELNPWAFVSLSPDQALVTPGTASNPHHGWNDSNRKCPTNLINSLSFTHSS